MAKSKKQFFWEFMRRHKRFRVGDAMIALDMNAEYARRYLAALQKAGYVRLENKENRFEDSIFCLLKDTGVQAPVIVAGEVVQRKGNIREKRKKRYSPTLLRLLDVMRSRVVTRQQLCNIAGVDPSSGSVKRAFKELVAYGVLQETGKRIDRSKAYTVDIERKNRFRLELLRIIGA